MPAQGRREQLLDAAVDHVAGHGVTGLSLRDLAAAIGTSHRMLIHHFGSKDELLVEVVHAVEARQRAALADLQAAGDVSVEEAGRRFWERLTDPSLDRHERLFFELYGQALQGRPWASSLLDGIVDDWLGPVRSLLVTAGSPEGTADADARLALAVARGLLLDLLATGDHAAVTAAMERFQALLASQVPS